MGDCVCAEGGVCVCVEGVCVPESGFIHCVHAFAYNVSHIYMSVCVSTCAFRLMEMCPCRRPNEHTCVFFL